MKELSVVEDKQEEGTASLRIYEKLVATRYIVQLGCKSRYLEHVLDQIQKSWDWI
jgi:hypothetical protein